jgi:hypothetical protein
MRLATLFLLTSCSLALAQGTDTPEFRQVMNNLSHEHIECASYYSLVSACLKNRGDSGALAEQYDKLVTIMLERALKAHMEAKLLPATFKARLDITSSELKKEIADDCGNISILSVRYGNSCKKLAENMSGRIEELINAEMAKRPQRE